MKGTYILLAKLENNRKIRIGSLGFVNFRKGYYAYVGSGMNSLEKRIERHLIRKKRRFWHIDYLLKKAEIVRIFYRESERKEECEISKELARSFESVRNFGCSDCRCESHLFRIDRPDLLEKISKALLLNPLPPSLPLGL